MRFPVTIPGQIEVASAKAKTRQRRLVEINSALAAWLEPYRGMEGKVSGPRRLERGAACLDGHRMTPEGTPKPRRFLDRLDEQAEAFVLRVLDLLPEVLQSVDSRRF